MPFFTYPLAWIAAIALPALAAIYFLRHRYRKQSVSSLLLWQMHRESREGGRRVEKPQFPLVFFLELLVLALLVLAATGPRWQVPSTTRPLIVVLDDSQSMLAGPEDSSPRALAMAHLDEVTQERRFRSFQLIIAGPTPGLLSDRLGKPELMMEKLEDWSCRAPEANLEAAIRMARALGHNNADILVLTDAPPDREIPAGRLRWNAFGKPRLNFGFINAARSPHADGDRAMLEIANLSAQPGTNTVKVFAGTNLIHEAPLNLGTNAARKLTIPLPAGTPALRAELAQDALLGDNRIDLLPPLRRTVRVQLSITNSALSSLLTDTLSATGMRAATNQPPELVIHQSDNVPAGKEAWSLRLMPVPEKPERYTGPFVIDMAHPLTRGLSLPGIVWGAHPGATNTPGFLPVITAGNIPLLTHRTLKDGREQLNLTFAPEHSTMHDTPQWPALIWNLLQWRTRAQNGLTAANHRLGLDVPYRPAGTNTILTLPTDTQGELASFGDEIRLPITGPGVHWVESGPATNRLKESFAVNFLAGAESSLVHAETGEWGRWGTDSEIRFEYATIMPYLVFLGLMLMAGHLYAIHKQGGRI